MLQAQIFKELWKKTTKNKNQINKNKKRIFKEMQKSY